MNQEQTQWNAITKQTKSNSNLVEPPKRPPPVVLRRYKETQERLKTHYLNLLVALKKAPIYLVSVHGLYDLLKEPVPWTVPPNTFIFEAQSIGDLTLTLMDNPLWHLCLTENRTEFFNYFLGDESKVPKPNPDYVNVFRNLIVYKPGDIIYERRLQIGGGKGDRTLYTNMGFYKFDKDTPTQPYPQPTTVRPMTPTEIGELNPLRTTLITDDKFSITNKQYVNMVTDGIPIQYKGSKLHPPQSFIIKRGEETFRIFIFSTCAQPDCLQKVTFPKALMNQNKENFKERFNKEFMYTKTCSDRLEKIERHQQTITLDLSAMGIHTGPRGAGWAANIAAITNVFSENTPRYKSYRIRETGAEGQEEFYPGTYAEKFSVIDPDIENWWKYIDKKYQDKAALKRQIVKNITKYKNWELKRKAEYEKQMTNVFAQRKQQMQTRAAKRPREGGTRKIAFKIKSHIRI